MTPQTFKYKWTENLISADQNNVSVVYDTVTRQTNVTAYVLDPVHQTALIWIPTELKTMYIDNEIPLQYISSDPIHNLKYQHIKDASLSGWFVCSLNCIEP